MRDDGSLPDAAFKVLFQASPEVLLVLLPDSPRFTMVAATAARFDATHTSPETLGRGLFEVFPDNPDDLEASGTGNLRASLERVLATRQSDTMAVQKYDIRGPDGTFQKKYWSPKNIPVLSAEGKVVYILHRVEDVTELIQASEEGEVLRDRTREMEREVVRRSRELAEANTRLRDANQKLGEVDAAKTAFFSNVSHEFRTPLTLILAPLEAALRDRHQLREENSGPAPQLTTEELASMHRNALRLLRLVNSLLDFSRLEAGRTEVSFSPEDLSSLTAGLAGAFQSLLDDAGLRLTVDCPKLPAPIYVDPAQWEKIVLNLISNAFKFTFSGEIAVRQVWCGDHVELSVSDTGTGIPEHELPHVFERFRRVEGAKGRSYEGTGIGLSLVHELLQLHGGSVKVESKVGVGSTFTVSVPAGTAHLPADRVLSEGAGFEAGALLQGQLGEARQWLGAAPSEQPPSAPPAAAQLAAAKGGKKSQLLVADDNADMRAYIARLLSTEWDVRAVADGKAALAAAKANPPDLILSDVMMPELDGVQLLTALRAHPSTSGIPVILLSARAGEDARIEGLETGADDYLVKPFAARELMARVRTQLALSKANRELQASYRELKATQAQLIQTAKMASLGQLVAGIAHEFNNPLAFLLGHLKTIERSLSVLEPLLPSEPQNTTAAASFRRARERASDIETGLLRIQELVQKLRAFSRLDEGQLNRVSIQECVDGALTILRHRCADRIELQTTFAGPSEMECDASLLNQALVNVLTNSIDAIEGQGKIEISAQADSSHMTIRVSDTGRGVPAALRDRVFEPFFTTKPVGQGTGLGLSITYSIIQKHHGTIELSPREGGGTEVVMRLPLRPITAT